MWTAFLSLFSWVGKIPAPVRKWGGIALVGLAFLWVAYSAGADDAKDKAAVKEAVALREQAEAHAAKMAAVVETMSQANANVAKTEVRVIRERDNARREINAAPGASARIDPQAWAAARSAMLRIDSVGVRDGASDGDDPPAGGIIAGPVG